MTELLFLEDTYELAADATLAAIDEDERGRYWVLDRTVFYPQGGGQPSDVGTISIEGSTVEVTFVAMTGGQVRHYVDPDAGSYRVGAAAALAVDKIRRLQNAKAHTAGHLIQAIVEDGDFGLRAVKGYHFPGGPYVEFEGTPGVDKVELADRLEGAMAAVVSEGRPVSAWSGLASEPAMARILAQRSYQIPADKPLRVVQIEGFEGVPCGGTHLKSLAELSSVGVRKVKTKKGNSQVSYTFE